MDTLKERSAFRSWEGRWDSERLNGEETQGGKAAQEDKQTEASAEAQVTSLGDS